MSNTAIVAAGIGKRYEIKHQRERYGRLTESLTSLIRSPIDRLRGQQRETSEWVWALQDVSFDIAQGDVVGIIGRNGAGKTTLLKLLSQITAPSAGRADLYGRVASLLEVGTGFHPELTGRENIYLSGSILGMQREEIVKRFDEIVEFSGVEQYLDTPVKRYSSGMQVRLGFAVAAHLEPEILLVDEVLAVGDASFQAKCLGRIQEIGGSGRTVIFVSHNMPSILRLCPTAMLLDRGKLLDIGPSSQVVRTYLESDIGRTSERHWESPESAPGDDVARLKSVRAVPASGGVADEIDIRSPIDIEVEYWTKAPGTRQPFVNLHFYNDEGVCLFITGDHNNQEWRATPREAGLVRTTCRLPGNFLAEGRVIITTAVSSLEPVTIHAMERDAIAFQIVDRSEGDGVRGAYVNEYPGVVRPMLEWSTSQSVPRQERPQGGTRPGNVFAGKA